MTGAAPIMVETLSLDFTTLDGDVQVLDHVSFKVDAGEIVGLVGESGSGKTVAAMALLRLLPANARRRGGDARVLGRDVFALSERELENLRGAEISMVFQEPMTALNPSLMVERQIVDVIRRHTGVSQVTAKARARALLADMEIRDVARVLDAYPFELSGGMRQRVLLAMAFSCAPTALVADEPTTALDVTVQAQVLRLLETQARKTGTAVLLITHDMGVVHQLCNRVYVMHAGQIVEEGTVEAVLRQPRHPYTQGLLATLPERNTPKQPLRTLAGPAVSLADPPPGCRFAPRCAKADGACAAPPPLVPVEGQSRHAVACWHSEG